MTHAQVLYTFYNFEYNVYYNNQMTRILYNCENTFTCIQTYLTKTHIKFYDQFQTSEII